MFCNQRQQQMIVSRTLQAWGAQRKCLQPSLNQVNNNCSLHSFILSNCPTSLNNGPALAHTHTHTHTHIHTHTHTHKIVFCLGPILIFCYFLYFVPLFLSLVTSPPSFIYFYPPCSSRYSLFIMFILLPNSTRWLAGTSIIYHFYFEQ